MLLGLLTNGVSKLEMVLLLLLTVSMSRSEISDLESLNSDVFAEALLKMHVECAE